MFAFRLLTWLCLITVLFYGFLLCWEDLANRCESPVESWAVQITVMAKALLGYPPPDPPWWRVVCPWVPVRPHDRSTIVFSDLSLLLAAFLLPSCGLLLFLGKKELQEIRIGCRRTGNAQIAPILCKPLSKSREEAEPEKVEHTPKPDEMTTVYRNILLGPINKSFEALKILIWNCFSALSISSADVTWAFDKDKHGNLTLMVAQTQAFRVRVFSDPHGLDIHVCYLGRILGKYQGATVREMTVRKYITTYRGIKQTEESKFSVVGEGWAKLNIIQYTNPGQ